jgi:hypothetical protein
MQYIIEILRILVVGGILAAVLNLMFHWLSRRRQYRQALEQKMIERVSGLVEGYYGQTSSASAGLRSALNDTLARIAKGEKTAHARQICFFHLIRYLHHVERLTEERPKPLLAEMTAEKDYIQQIKVIYEAIPFGYYDISFLLNRCQTEKGLIPVHEFVEIIEKEDKLKTCYQRFCEWLNNCRCSEAEDKNCNVHRVIVACLSICMLLDDQTMKMYRLWYERRRKRPKID